jgi:hypothetical protein
MGAVNMEGIREEEEEEEEKGRSTRFGSSAHTIAVDVDLRI